MSENNTEEKGYVALKAFFGITHDWHCSHDEQSQLLGGIDDALLAHYATLPHVQLPEATMKRISLVMGIYRALRTLYPTEELANERVRRTTTDSPFEGRSAMDLMVQGDLDALLETRRYFAAQCL